MIDSLIEDCGNTYTLYRIWLADYQGSIIQAQQKIIVQDTNAPGISAPLDITVTCDAYQNNNIPFPDAFDNCSVNPTFSWGDDTSQFANCEGVVIRDWLIFDECGNGNLFQQTITVINSTNPPSPCSSIFDWQQTIFEVLTDIDTNNTKYMFSEKWQALMRGESCDYCDLPEVRCDSNRYVTGLVFISIYDQSGFTIEDNKATARFGGQMTTLPASIGRLEDLEWIYAAFHKISAIPQEIGSLSKLDNINLRYNQLTTIPKELGNLPNLEFAFFQNNQIECLAQELGNLCPTIRIFNIDNNPIAEKTSWRNFCVNPIDICANDDEPCVVNQPIAPTISNVPLDITISCEEDLPTLGDIYALNQCGDTITVSFTDDIIGTASDCDTKIERFYFAEDSYGNTAQAYQIIYIEDKIRPVLGGIPLDITLQCDESIPAPATAFATDNCTSDVTIQFEESRINGDCPNAYTLTRTWRAIDDCGNVDINTQTISIIDQTPPILLEIPTDITITAVLGNDLSEIPTPVAIDNCDESIDFTFVDGDYESLNCGEQFTRTWSAIDDCGNVTEVSQRITIVNGTDIVPFIGPDQTIAQGTSTQLEAAGGLNIFWSPEDKLVDPFVANPQTVALNNTTQFCATIFDDDACVTTVCMTVFVEEEETPPLDCSIVNVEGGDEQIEISNIQAFYTKIELVGKNTNWEVLTICDGNCESEEIINGLAAGDYILKIQQAQNEEYCYIEVPATVTSEETPTNQPANCDAVDLTVEDGQLTIYNLSANYQKVELIGANTNWELVTICEGDCEVIQVVPNLSAGDYTIKISLGGIDGSFCYKEENITISGSTPPPPTNFANCDAVDLTVEDGQLTIYNLSANYQKVEIIGANTNWELVTICEGDCEAIQVVPNLSAGDYTVKIALGGTDGSFCYKEENITISGGTPPPSINPANCDIIDVFGEIGTITIYNLTAAYNKVAYIGSGTNWEVLTVCDGDCDATQTINNVPDGAYSVKIEQEGADGSYCFKQFEVFVSSTGAVTACNTIGVGDTDGDGICDDEDNCLTIPNTDQADNDNDGIGNVCDDTPNGAEDADLETINCGAITIQYGNGKISYAYTGNEDITYKLSDVNRGIYFVAECSANCATNATFDNLPPGIYNLQIWADWKATCEDYPAGGFMIELTENADSRNTIDFGAKLEVYPNPALSEVFLNLADFQNEKVEIALYNSFAQSVYQKQLDQVTSKTERIDLNNFDNGLYLLKIKVGQHKVVTKKLIITRMY